MTRDEQLSADILAKLRVMYAPAGERAAMERKATLSRIMKRAWHIARTAAQVFGGAPSNFIKGAMQQAWAEHRGEIDPLNAERTLLRIQARTMPRLPQSRTGYRGRNWYASAVGA